MKKKVLQIKVGDTRVSGKKTYVCTEVGVYVPRKKRKKVKP